MAYIFQSAGSTPTNKGKKERSGSTHLTEANGRLALPRPQWKVLMFELVCLHLRERGYEGEDAGRL